MPAINSPTPDATNLSKGKIQLAGDLAGTSALPVVGTSKITFDKAATGFAVQVVTSSYNAVATGTTVMPLDDTIPQITEGNEYMTVTITPKATTHTLVIEADFLYSTSANAHTVWALFQDATANALAADTMYQAVTSQLMTSRLIYTMAAGTTSATTFRLRIGPASAATTTFNGTGGGRLFGAITKSTMTVTEYKA